MKECPLIKLKPNYRKELIEGIFWNASAETIQFPPDKTRYRLDVMPDWIILDIAYTLGIVRRPGNPPPLPKRRIDRES